MVQINGMEEWYTKLQNTCNCIRYNNMSAKQRKHHLSVFASLIVVNLRYADTLPRRLDERRQCPWDWRADIVGWTWPRRRSQAARPPCCTRLRLGTASCSP